MIQNPPNQTQLSQASSNSELAIFSKLPKTGDYLFDKAIRVVFEHEGYYSNDLNDPGGPTKWGWSLRAVQEIGDLDGDGILDFDLDLDGDVDIDDIKQLSADIAIQKYFDIKWKPFPYNKLGSSGIAIKAFDLSIVMGERQAHKLLQRAIRSVNGEHLADDGIIGPKTLEAIYKCNPIPLMAAYRSEAAGFFRLLVRVRPKSEKYLNGWLNRAYY